MIDYISLGIAILGVLLALKSLFSREATPDEVLEELEQLSLEVDELRKDMEINDSDLLDRIEGILEPLNNRLASRERRRKEKEGLNSPEPLLKQGGMISLAEAKKYGLIK